jgi:trafficking protein particle complex subunit 11
VFAEQIDIATRHGFKLPVPLPVQSSVGSPPMGSSPFLGSSGYANQAEGGSNPGELLQHAGFYFHLAAMCSAERRRRYIDMEKWKASEAKTDDPTYRFAMAALTEEEQIDHSALTIELLTKGYEQFKKHRNTRMTLYLAAEIAGTYYEAGKFEMALKFFERIGKTYRKESWHTVLTSILRWSLRCAKELGMTTSVVGYLVELLCDDLPMSQDKRSELQNDLQSTLIHESLNDDDKQEPLIIRMDDINSFLTCHVQFEKPSGFVNRPMHFQISFSTNKSSPPQPIVFRSLRTNFNNERWNQIYLNDEGDKEDKDYSFYDCTNSEYDSTEKRWSANAGLQFRHGQSKVFEGAVTLDHSKNLKVRQQHSYTEFFWKR